MIRRPSFTNSLIAPAIVVLPVESVEKAYLAWLLEATDAKSG